MMTAPEPIVFVTQDGAERKFRLTNSRLLRFAQQQAKSEDKDGLSTSLNFLWITCEDKGDLTQEEFFDLLPFDVELLAGLAQRIHDRFQADSKSTSEVNEQYRPTTAETRLTNGSGLLVSGEPTSARSKSSGTSARAKQAP